ncbi:MAG TPA: sigma-54 dependent transcriptional regulator [Steroidobacteraceae bacterium]|nr:sigma-54 dependent transcriptional regulator [Steroidobacteraceae bacterium]
MNVATIRLSDQSAPLTASSSLLGTSAVMQEVFRLIERVGPTEASVLLTGESGSGKELAARSIHDQSQRCGGPFIAINCGAIPAGLIEAELFGFEKGSFTGAVRSHAGVFERANGGTLLLDEITEMPLDMQIRLLRVLETKMFYRVGASAELSTDVRVVAATNRCPLQAVQSGQLREDLLYRLAVFPIDLPPLRNRGDDVDLLAEHFLADLNAQAGTEKRFTALSRVTLKQHAWPGNVRELKNCVERAFILGDQWLELAPLIQNAAPNKDADPADDRERLDIRVGSRIYDMERSLIEATLDYFQGNKRRAADALGCSLKTLYNKLNSYAQRRASGYAQGRVNGYSQSHECTSS